MKKKLIDEIRQWATLAVFCAAAVLFYLNNAKLDKVEKAVIEFQKFQNKQDKINDREGIVYNWALQKLMGIEIHEIFEEDETDP